MPVFTAEEISTFTSMKVVLDFAKISESIGAAFLDVTGSAHDTMPRALGIVPEDTFAAVLDEVLVPVEGSPHRALKFAERASLLLVGSACRASAGIFGVAAPPSGAPSLALAIPTAIVRKIKLGLVCSQADDTEIELLGTADMDIGYGRWEALFGIDCRPDPDAMITRGQLSAVKYMLDADMVPYVDYAIWGPHGSRMEKKMKLGGQVWQANGTFRYIEIAGPPTIEVWNDAFDVMQTAFVFLDVLDLGTMVAYKKFINTFHALHGPQCWLLLYQSETRFRLEHLERVRHDLNRAHLTALAAKGNTPFEIKRPWNYTFQKGLDDDKWWKREFTDPAILFLTRTANLQAFIGGDAPISSASRSFGESIPQTIPAPSPAVVPRQPKQPKHPVAPGLPAIRQELKAKASKGADGLYILNNGGKRLCGAFQTGACGTVQQGRCPADGVSVHQCNRCLHNSHGGNICTGGGGNISSNNNRGNGRGSGKGNGKANKGVKRPRHW